MRQRVAFLRTLLAGKPVLALDEPFAALDAITRAEMQEWLARALSADPRTVVLVSHDVEEALYLCDRVAVLSARPGRIVAELSAPAPRAPRARRRGHRPGLRRRPRGSDAGAAGGVAVRRWLLPALLLAALLAAWQIAASTGAIADALSLEDFLVPAPSEIADSLWQSRSLLAENGWVTLKEILLGIAIAVVCGIGFAVVMRRWVTIRDATYPLIIASQTVPIIVIAPILTVWFGYGIFPKLVIIALICFFPITISALAGLNAADPDATKLMRTLDASRWQIFRRVEAPGALPSTFAGIKIAVVVAPIAAVFGEWAGSTSGLGHLILTDNAQLEVARQFAAIAVLSAIALVLIGLIALVERRVVTWR